MFEILMTANVLILVVNSFYLGMKWEQHKLAALSRSEQTK